MPPIKRREDKQGTIGLSNLNENERKNVNRFIRKSMKFGTNNAIGQLINTNFGTPRKDNEELEIYSNPSIGELGSENSFDVENSELWSEDEDSNELKHSRIISVCELEEGEEECMKEYQKKSKCMLSNESLFKEFWDQLQLAIMIYTAVVAPFKIVFVEDYEFPYWEKFDYLIDFLFFLDIFVNFFTPIPYKEKVISTHCEVALMYLKFWFWIDFISIIPINILFSKLDFIQNYSILLRISKMPRLYKFLKGAKMLRTIKVKKKGRETFVTKILLYFASSDHISFYIIPVYMLGLIIAHWFSCLWYFISDSITNPDNWIDSYHYRGEQVFDRYCASLYYVYTTMSTTGYGDIIPKTFEEGLLTIILIFSGVTFYSLIYSQMLLKFAEYSDHNSLFNNKVDLLRSLRKKDKAIDTQTYKEMLVLIEDSRKKRKELMNEKLPSFVRVKPRDATKLMLEVCSLKYHFQNLAPLKDLPNLAWIQFLEGMEERIYSRGEVIFEEGTPSGHFYVVKRGKLWLMTKPFKKIQVEEKDFKHILHSKRSIIKKSGTLSEKQHSSQYPFVEIDSYIGEFGLIHNVLHRYTCIAKKNTILYSITKSVFLQIFREEARMKSMKRIARRRMRNFYNFEEECSRLIRGKQFLFKKISKKAQKIELKLKEEYARYKKLGMIKLE